MSIFVVTYLHRNAEGWQKHLLPHVEYLQDILKSGILRASGPFRDTPEKSAMLIMSAQSHAALLEILDKDPFMIEGLVEDMTITEWDPIFGAFNADSSRPT